MKYIICGTAIFLWGLFMLLRPQTFWTFFESWKNEGSTSPSKSYALQIRISGCICMAVGLVIFIGSFFADSPL